MGISGLTSLVEDNRGLLLRRSRLHDTGLIIDGNNFVYIIYNSIAKGSKYGGDYSLFATTVHKFFTKLHACNVEAVVVMDGGIDPDERKIPTLYKRFKNKLLDARKASECQSSAFHGITPLCYLVFMDVLSSLSVPTIRAPFEGDPLTAQLARELNCPVLSNDSDFYVYDLNVGIISSKGLIYAKTLYEKRSHYHYLNCELYSFNGLCRYFPGLTREVLPVFSTLTGNDCVDVSAFDAIFRKYNNFQTHRPLKSDKLNVRGDRQAKMVGLLNWLKERPIAETVDILVEHLKGRSKETLLLQSIEKYKRDNSALKRPLRKDLSDLSSLVTRDDFLDPSLPDWFVDEFRRSHLPSLVYEIIRQKTLFLRPGVEDYSLPSSHSCGQELRQYLFALLTTGAEELVRTCVDRSGDSLDTYSLSGKRHTSSGYVLPHLTQIRSISSAKRRVLFEAILSIDGKLWDQIKDHWSGDESSAESDTNGAVFLILVIKYWISKCEHKIWHEFLYALITGIMFCGYVDDGYNGHKCLSFDKTLIKRSADALKAFNSRAHPCSRQPFQSRIIHFYSQFQVCVRLITIISRLLNMPFPMTCPFTALNGTFIYNLTVKLSSIKDPKQYLLDLFAGESSAVNVFTATTAIISDGFNENKFVLKANDE